MVFLALLGAELDNGQRVWIDTLLLVAFAAPPIFFWVVKPVVVARDQALDGARFLALHDPLTRLPNRRLIYEHIDRCLSSFPRHSQFGALIYFDLDGFKTVNDKYGHKLGDAVLVEIAGRLKQITRAEDVPCRLGGDEFVVLIHNVGTDEASARQKIETIALKIASTIKQPLACDGIRVQVGCSIGVRVLSPRRADADQVLLEADQAMYYAKKNAPGSVVFADKISLKWYGIAPIGIEEIDRDHRAIDALVTEALLINDGKLASVRRIAEALIEHFSNERRISGLLALNFRDEHVLEHRRLTALVTALASRSTEETAHADVMALWDLIRRHAAEYDRELVHATHGGLAEQAV